uniref:NR LBD domain-containing protein n=1 Tax=Caenorhabditis tropicalis TaxID=1561998 RepID=A0A1I7TZY7_9PELO
MWKNHLKNACDSLGTVLHLLKEEHSDDHVETDSISSNPSIPNQEINGNRLYGMNTDSYGLNAEVVYGVLHKEERRVAYLKDFPSSRDSVLAAFPFHYVRGAIVFERTGNTSPSDSSSDALHISKMRDLSIGESSGSSGDCSWAIEAFKGASNIVDHSDSFMEVDQNRPVVPPNRHRLPRRLFAEPQFPEQPQANDPALFHLNSCETPPPSPGNELEDYEFNMQPDMNGVIPNVADMHDPIFEGQANNNSDDAHVCNLELCKSFHHFLITTADNVQDKQSILKEILQHADQLLVMSAENAPQEMKEPILEIRDYVYLINNCLDRSCTLDSYKSNTVIGLDLVVKFKNKLEDFIGN